MVFSEAGLIEVLDLFEEPVGDHPIAALVDAGVEDLFGSMEEPASEVVGDRLAASAPDELADLAAYILSLREEEKGR